jgi:predicted alpha/beta superfamily hydrolase
MQDPLAPGLAATPVRLGSAALAVDHVAQTKRPPENTPANNLENRVSGADLLRSVGETLRVNNDQSPLADTEVHYLTSEMVNDEFKIFVGHCGTKGEHRVPVLYLTDANGYFGGAVDIVRSMQLGIHLPPLLIVGIGYRAGGIGDVMAPRTRDLTPTWDSTFARLYPDQQAMGGAGALLQFIEQELKPWVADRYDVDHDNATYFGHSFGGLFGVYVLLTAPAAFRRYIIGSPSVWWDDGAMFEYEPPSARTARSASEVGWGRTHADDPVVVYLGVGAHETHEGRHREVVNLPAGERAKSGVRYIDMVADTVKIAERLRQLDWLNTKVDLDVFPDEFHITVPLLTLSRGLRTVFDAPR